MKYATTHIGKVICLLGTFVGILSVRDATASEPGGAITRAEVLTRARAWYQHQPHLVYNSTRAPNTLIDDPDGQHRYGPDCSGMVSMAWHIAPGHFGGLNTHTLATVATPISADDLRPGDILLYAERHVILFEAWEPDGKHFSYYSFGSTPMRHGTHATLAYGDGKGLLSGSPVERYKAYRYRHIVDNHHAKPWFSGLVPSAARNARG